MLRQFWNLGARAFPELERLSIHPHLFGLLAHI